MTAVAAQQQVPQAQAPMFTLPRVKIKSVIKSPKNLVIIGKPKIGKTTILSYLENALHVDFEQGTDYVDAMKVKISSINELFHLARQIADEGYPYKYVILDTATALEEMCVPYAVHLYKSTPMGKNYTGNDVRTLAQGAGWAYFREAFAKVIALMKTTAPNLIIVGHIKETMLSKEGNELTVTDIALTGKNKQTTCSESDAIAYMHRKDDKTYLSFKTSDAVTCGARPDHLRGQDILISEMIDGELKVYWDKVFVD